MQNTIEQVWNTYSSAWGLETSEQKRQLFAECLSIDCSYADPHVNTVGWDELLDYMLDFHRQIPGGHFQVTNFASHNQQSMASWQLKDAQQQVVDEGTSFGRYDTAGKLISMTGFF